MGLNREVGGNVSEVEIYKRTSVSSTRLGQKNRNKSWCIRLYIIRCLNTNNFFFFYFYFGQ